MHKNFILLLFIGFSTQCFTQNIDELLLKDYRPISIYKTPKANIQKAKFPIIDMHSHEYASPEELDKWVKNMDEIGIEKTIILSYKTGESFDSIFDIYSKYPNRFDIWCGFDYTGYNEKGWVKKAIKELERCHKKGAKGVGELGDKGLGLLYSKPTPAYGMHIDDPRMKPLLEKCAELNMPINIHVAEPYWMYEPIDEHNDGLMNASYWKIDLSKEGILGHQELISTLENAVRDNPSTTFIACHFANCSYDLSIIGEMLDKYPNLYADISARYAETAPIPRYMFEFYNKYQDRLLYGTDMGFDLTMYRVTLRILESSDEHFYEIDQFSYHWPLNGFNLSDEVLKKLYKENALKILTK